jgi:hypothetical protein
MGGCGLFESKTGGDLCSMPQVSTQKGCPVATYRGPGTADGRLACNIGGTHGELKPSIRPIHADELAVVTPERETTRHLAARTDPRGYW